jgi:hypothetical protein
MRPLAGNERFPKSVYNALIDGMASRLLLCIFKKYYADHALLHDLSATFKHSCFWQILAAMQMTKNEVQSISAITRDTIGGQAFAANAGTFASHAERTLDCYSQGGGYTSGKGYRSDGRYCSKGGCSDSLCGSCDKLGQGDRCFGCQGPHPYIRNKVIVCPNKDKPGVWAAAKKAYQEWLEKSRKRNKKCKDKPFDYNKLNDRDKALARENVLASLCMREQKPDEASTITTDSSHPSDHPCDSPPSKQAKMTFLVVNVLVLSSASHNKSILLPPIMTNFPHIHLQLGTKLDCPKCPLLRCVINTAAMLTTGNFYFVAAVAKRYPHCIAKIFVPEDYNPIVLSGIVQQGGESVTTELTVGFQFHLPYLTKDRLPMSIVIATGPHVTVNTIIGLPFIQATRAIIDFV